MVIPLFRRPKLQPNDDEARNDEWEVVIDFLRRNNLIVYRDIDLRYLFGNKWNSIIFVAAILTSCIAFISPLIFDLVDFILVGRFVVYYICPSLLGIHLVAINLCLDTHPLTHSLTRKGHIFQELVRDERQSSRPE